MSNQNNKKELTVAEILEFEIMDHFDFSNDSEKAEFLDTIAKTLFQNLLVTIMEKSENKIQEKINQFLKDKKGKGEITEFLKENVEEFEEVFGEEVLNLKERAVKMLK